MQLTDITADERDQIRAFLQTNPTDNILLLAWLNLLGTNPDVRFWALIGQQGPAAVLGCFGRDWFLANPGGADPYPLAKLIMESGDASIRGAARAVGALARHLAGDISDRTCLVVGLPDSGLSGYEPGPRGAGARAVGAEEIAGLTGLWPEREELLAGMLGRSLAAGGRVQAVYEGERPAALAWTEAEAEGTALIGGVVTAPVLRRGGWGTVCLWALGRELLAGGLRPYLAYDEPIIGRMAGRLGFLPAGRWRRVECRTENAF